MSNILNFAKDPDVHTHTSCALPTRGIVARYLNWYLDPVKPSQTKPIAFKLAMSHKTKINEFGFNIRFCCQFILGYVAGP